METNMETKEEDDGGNKAGNGKAQASRRRELKTPWTQLPRKTRRVPSSGRGPWC